MLNCATVLKFKSERWMERLFYIVVLCYRNQMNANIMPNYVNIAWVKKWQKVCNGTTKVYYISKVERHSFFEYFLRLAF